MGRLLMLLAGNKQTQLFQINQSEESGKITINAHATSSQLHKRSITSAVHYNRIYSIFFIYCENQSFVDTLTGRAALQCTWTRSAAGVVEAGAALQPAEAGHGHQLPAQPQLASTLQRTTEVVLSLVQEQIPLALVFWGGDIVKFYLGSQVNFTDRLDIIHSWEMRCAYI